MKALSTIVLARASKLVQKPSLCSFLHKRGLDILMVMASERVLSGVLDKEGAELVREKLEENGFTIFTRRNVCEISTNGGTKKVMLDGGEEIDSDLVIIGKGIKPNVDLVKNSGIKFDKGILVDNWMKTNIENIYAAGDVAQAPDLLTSENTISPTWSNAVYQGVTAGSNMAGEKVRYKGNLRMNIINIFGLSVVSIGLRKKKECEVISKSSIRNYRKFLIKDDKLFGSLLVGNVNDCGIIQSLIRRQVDIGELKDLISIRSLNLGIILMNVYRLTSHKKI